jgi:hypothetical protein
MLRLAQVAGSAALCGLALGSMPCKAGAPRLEDFLPQNISVPQGARVFRDGTTMLYDPSGRGKNVTPDGPRTSNPDAAPNNFTVGGSAVVKNWQRPAAPPEVIAAWLEKCNPVVYEDSEHIRKVRYAAKDCDLTDPRQ